jgi:hypothetical protein
MAGGGSDVLTSGLRMRPGRNRALPPVFSLASPKGGEGRGEEAQGFTAQIPSPRSGGERETDAVSSCALDPLACD